MDDSITVVLTVWKRHNLEEQLIAIKDQTANIDCIYVYQNESHVDISHLKEIYDFKHVQSKDMNFKFHGRFTLPLLFNTKYTAIFDDDTIPNKGWLQHCKNLCDSKNCIVGANCRNNDGTGHGLCDGKLNSDPIKCDIVGHCWFFKSEWCKYLWMDRPHTWDNGEDIHLAASSQIHGDIKCYIPKQPRDDKEMWGDLEIHLGSDDHASWKKTDHSLLRGGVIRHWYNEGWRPLIMRS